MGIAERSSIGKPFGLSRVLDAKPTLPQAAERLDASLPIYANEVLIQVDKLNLDAASFEQMKEETGSDPKAIGAILLENSRTRGKQQNRKTGSGGMLIGTVSAVGSQFKGTLPLHEGDRIATLVSLTLTPLHLEEVIDVDLSTHQATVKGHAILFESSIAACLPSESQLPESVSMALFDVAGAPAAVKNLCKAGQRVVILGAGGKAGVLSCVAAREAIGKDGVLVAVEPGAAQRQALKSLNVCDAILDSDAALDPIAVHRGVEQVTHGKMGEVVVNVIPIPNTETATLLCASPEGSVLFYGMATDFARVALGAEGLASTATLLVGNGYTPNHAAYGIELIERNTKLKEIFFQRYARS